ncbi:MAG: hypothetical protein AB1567_08075 [bacterium]
MYPVFTSAFNFNILSAFADLRADSLALIFSIAFLILRFLSIAIFLKSASSGVKRGEGGEKEGYFDKFGRELRIR